ncbi:MAG: UDP-N-acetylmuramoyl-tripeptide--D-alanyl-D-alanine ligase [Pseudomonadota bacterium]
MFSQITLQDLVQWTNAKLSSSLPSSCLVTTLSSDSRTFKPGEVFIALSGESFDGHQFIQEVVEKGALAVIGEKKPASWTHSVPFLEVASSLGAYVAIGKALRKKFRGKVLAVTGSAGKSSTKDMLGVLLGPHTLVSPKSFNNLLGVSKTLCLLEDQTKNLVLEMGMNGLGEIREMCENFRPEGGAITNIGDAHIGKLGGREGIYKAKKELFDWFSKSDVCLGIALNLDDPMVVRAAQEAFVKPVKRVSFSARDSKADIFISERKIDSESGALSLKLKTGGGELAVKIPHFGIHHSYNLAASVAMARLADVSWKEIEERLPRVLPSESRGQITQLPNQITLIDESYNSNPSALISSLESVVLMNSNRRKLLVIGEMRELEQFSESLHREVGKQIGKIFSERAEQTLIFGVGEDTRVLLDGIQNVNSKISTFYADTVQRVEPQVIQSLESQDLVFVKGSRGVSLDSLVRTLKAKSTPKLGQ